ncbi:MAG: aldo/keto reductase [Halobellus sp.]|uniref:aldo/keto reductase n=1 Tax=Halobellus sp. TaxID=1979212 RepID=UPI0035D414A7
MDFPPIGLGTYDLTDPETCETAVATAVDDGYDHIDTAQGYGNEAVVASGLERADRDADEVLLATKLETGNLGSDDVVATARESADRLGVDSIDLLYVHWPINTYHPEETLPALDRLVEDGLVERVGLSNFRPDQLAAAIDRLDAPVAAHQVEMHPLLPQSALHALAVEEGHQLVAYCPIARNQVADVPQIADIAAAHDVTAAQVSLAWLHAKDRVTPIPRSSTPEHIRENHAALDLDLTADEMATLDAIDRRHRVVDFDAAPWNQ